jgi:hypothetical protein
MAAIGASCVVIMGLFMLPYESAPARIRLKDIASAWFFLGAGSVDPTQRLCDSMAIAVKGTLFCVHHWNAENRDLIRIRICGFSDSTINGFLVMGHSQFRMLCYVDVGQTLFFQGGRIPRSDGKEARVGRSDG